MYQPNKTDTVIKWAAKILQWVNIVSAVLVLIGSIYTGILNGSFPKSWQHTQLPSVYGFSIAITFGNASQHKGELICYAIGAIAILCIFAYAFMNLYKAFDRMHRNPESGEPTPFSPEITKAVRNIGVALVLVWVIGTLVAAALPFGHGFSEGWTQGAYDLDGTTTSAPSVSVKPDISTSPISIIWLVAGIFIFCVARILRYGETLQREHDELI
ncbi:hypothetical protein OZX73_04900 [Bifidobacterium sp. ESL0775]|uniref:hypothetical protein n=1 Tax=Bifidobacterium sp. ESL0775 TaxID=2983230 RepID=UPI0023F8FFCC|nr:hypothetical protein [Bifidobacterium sp. ESL0775]WEV68635.1 hypothetical protein OZX73_04900 [Bifidobacterium sp. ESL0775]